MLNDEELLDVIEVEERVQILTIVEQACRRGAHGVGEWVQRGAARAATAAAKLRGAVRHRALVLATSAPGAPSSEQEGQEDNHNTPEHPRR